MTASIETGEFSTDSLPPDTLPSDIGGYRLVRVLGSDQRAATALVHAHGTTRVARVFRASCPLAAIDAELAVHDVISAADEALRQHTVVADDLATLPGDRLALLLDQVAGPLLDDLLAARRGSLSLGEAVTLLAPIAQALEAAHAVGLTGLGLSPRAVRLSAGGAPVIVRLQDALAGPALPERFRALEPAYAHDLAALERLGAAVAAAVPEQDRHGLLTALRAPALGRALAPALFDLAQPEPVLLASETGRAEVRPHSPTDSARPGHDRHPAEEGREVHQIAVPGALSAGEASDKTRVDGTLPTWLTAAVDAARVLGLPAAVVDPIQAAAARVVAAVDRWARQLQRASAADARSRPPRRASGIRTRFVVAGAAGAAALVIALALIAAPPGAVESAASGVGTTGNADSALDPQRDPGLEANGERSEIESDAVENDAAESDTPESALHPQEDGWQGLVSTLVDRWSACRASAEADHDAAECAGRVAHAGSAAERLLGTDDARHAVLERWSALGGEAVVVERMGGAVLVDLVAAGTTTASLLVVRSEAGWRIRDVIG